MALRSRGESDVAGLEERWVFFACISGWGWGGALWLLVVPSGSACRWVVSLQWLSEAVVTALSPWVWMVMQTLFSVCFNSFEEVWLFYSFLGWNLCPNSRLEHFWSFRVGQGWMHLELKDLNTASIHFHAAGTSEISVSRLNSEGVALTFVTHYGRCYKFAILLYMEGY